LATSTTSCISQTEEPGKSDPTSATAFVSDRSGNLDIFLIQPDGSGLTLVTDNPAVDSDPDWAPDGSQIVFYSKRDGSADIFVMAADGSRPVNHINNLQDSTDDELALRWNPDGTKFSLYTDRFAPRGSCLTEYHQLALLGLGGSEKGLDQFDTVPGEHYASTWSPDWRYLVFNSSRRVSGFQLYIYDSQTGDTDQLTRYPYPHTNPAWSHNGKSLAFVANVDGNNDFFILDLATKEQTRITQHLAKDTQPTLSTDESQIAYVTNRDGNLEIYIMDADGSNPHYLIQHPASDWYPSWSPVFSNS
jgi:Tol biopolymer transport system component